ncbi:hypothetical protein [Christiangramia aquimixticola]|uniref:hypothetical protein n=1 Tax=Christiangramia aquimixticola TaxID=1697558 RepID=UPI003AA8B801
MNKSVKLFSLSMLLAIFSSYSQDNNEVSENGSLFHKKEVLPINLRYSNKDIKKETNDSTYIITYLKFEDPGAGLDSIEVRLRKRGNFRLKNCFYAPIKIKIKKKAAKNTLFEGHKNLKLVLPCLVERDRNDNILKEYLAYKLYEVISPFHFKTRLLEISYEEERAKKIKLHNIRGFLVEDDKNVAKRLGGKVIDANTHPLNQASLESVRNAFFQYMIGNTDFSTAYLHNCKLILLEDRIIPVPYDFDMAGLVNTSYATVSQINDQKLNIEEVTQRVYRGFKRNPRIYMQVREEFLENQSSIMNVLKEGKDMFESDRQFATTIKYIDEFFEILEDDKKFQKNILDVARIK